MPSSAWAGSPAGCEGSRAQRSLVLLVGMLGHPGGRGRWWQTMAVPITVARQRFTFCLATRRSSLSLAVGVRVASTSGRSSKTIEGGTSTRRLEP
jgi:hypothetical protein